MIGVRLRLEREQNPEERVEDDPLQVGAGGNTATLRTGGIGRHRPALSSRHGDGERRRGSDQRFCERPAEERRVATVRLGVHVPEEAAGNLV